MVINTHDVDTCRRTGRLCQRVLDYLGPLVSGPGQQCVENLIGESGRVEPVASNARDSLLLTHAEHLRAVAE